MSLASVHILFISLCIVLVTATGLWGMRSYFADASITGLVWGLISLAAVPVLLVYGVRVRRKLRELAA